MPVAITDKLYHRLVRLACSYAAQPTEGNKYEN